MFRRLIPLKLLKLIRPTLTTNYYYLHICADACWYLLSICPYLLVPLVYNRL